MAFAVAFGVWTHAEPTFFLRQPAFLAPLLLSSSALFFVPDKWAKKGALKFLHYPWPDWDVLLLGPASHRNWLTHSPLLPALLLGAAWKWPVLAGFTGFAPLLLGLSLGTASHLFWDCVGSERHKIVVVPYWFALREAPSRLWLLGGAAACLCIAGAVVGAFEGSSASPLASAFAGAQNLGL